MTNRASSAGPPPDELLQYAEDVGLTFESLGLPRMMGRVLGWLLVADPPHQSFSELTEVLKASKGSISTTTRGLIKMGLVERISFPGERRDYFRIREGGWIGTMHERLQSTADVRRLAERGLRLLDDAPEERKRGLREMHRLYAFFERELPILIERLQRESS